MCDGESDCPDASDESQDLCDGALVKNRRTQVTDDNNVTEDSVDDDNYEEMIRINPCSAWPPLCGQICISGGDSEVKRL